MCPTMPLLSPLTVRCACLRYMRRSAIGASLLHAHRLPLLCLTPSTTHANIGGNHSPSRGAPPSVSCCSPSGASAGLCPRMRSSTPGSAGLTRFVSNTGNGVAIVDAMRIEMILMNIYAVRGGGA